MYKILSIKHIKFLINKVGRLALPGVELNCIYEYIL